ncbi:MAG: PEP-utilizing enzyme [Dehalococcoidia bacterium]
MTQPDPASPAAAEFPVRWPRPDDGQLFWMQDAVHLPNALTPLDATMVQAAFTEGASRAISRLSMPITGIRAEVFNGYTYLAPLAATGSEDELAQRFAEMQRLTMELGATVLQDWRETFEPRVLALCDEILDFDTSSASLAEHAQHAASCYDRLVTAWDIHMRVNIPPMNAVFGLEEFLGAVLDEEAVAASRQLLQGFDNKTIEMGRALWEFSRWVREDRALAELVERAGTVDEITAAQHPRASAFAARWQTFLDGYGWRCNRFMEIGFPSWREDPTTALQQLRNFVAAPDDDDPYAGHRRQAAERDGLVEALAARLPADAVPQFRAMLPLAQQYIPVAEDHNFTIDQKFHTVVREGLLRFGQRLVAEGLFDDPDDAFYLRLDEIRALAADGQLAASRDTVRERRLEHRRQSAFTPPPVIGTPPPADAPPDPLITKFFGLALPPKVEARTIHGMAASPGVVEGVAKVVITLDEAGKLEPGDILVCRATMPPWTPLFGIAAAIVADTGGPLSHCAIVAREYGLPCVAGTQVATREITDGMRLRVDGGKGTVEILS